MAALRARGFTAIDTDDDDWRELSVVNGDPAEWILQEGRMYELLAMPGTYPLFISGCSSNQRKFYKFFDYKILFSAPLDVILDRVAKRTSNPYGKSGKHRAEISWNYEHVQPMLKESADLEIDTVAMGVSEVTEFLTVLALNQR